MKKSALKQLIREAIEDLDKPFQAFGGTHTSRQVGDMEKNLKGYKDLEYMNKHIKDLEKKGHNTPNHKENPHYLWSLKQIKKLKNDKTVKEATQNNLEQNSTLDKIADRLRFVKNEKELDSQRDYRVLSSDAKQYVYKLIFGTDDLQESQMKPEINEDQLNEEFSPETDEVGSFWVTTIPTLSSIIDDISFECKDVASFCNQVKGGMSLNTVKGIFKTEAKAKKLGQKLLDERDKRRTEVKKSAEDYKKMKEETLAKVQEYMKTKSKTKKVVDELKDVTKS